MATKQKATIYIDVDDEITSIIDKVTNTEEPIVALVLPKRATVLQSTVNMKLLKRAADDAKKKIVLITSEANLLPLAGAVGLYVAKTLQSKPAIPAVAGAAAAKAGALKVTDNTDDDIDASEEPDIDPSTPVGELAGESADADEDAIEVDNETPADADEAKPDADAKTKSKGKKDPTYDKKLKVPSFERFRLLLIGGAVLLALLIAFVVWATKFAPSAKITIKTNTQTVNSNVTFTASTSAKTIDVNAAVLPATQKKLDKTDSTQVNATGKKDNGTKASGTMTLTNCIDDGQAHTVPAGTTFSSGSLVFSTDEAVTLDPALFSGQTCKSANFGLSKTVDVTAAQPGDASNLSARSYNSSIPGILAQGSNMTGGTSNLVTVVSQADVDAAKQKMLDTNGPAAKSALQEQFKQANMTPLSDTFATTNPVVSSSPAVGEEGTQATVKLAVTYTMLGVSNADLKQLLANDAGKQIDISKQTITQDGVAAASFRIVDNGNPNAPKLIVTTTVVAGPQQNADELKKEVAGKKKGDTKALLLARPGITDVDIKYSPFWVGKTPSKTGKITIVFESK